MKKEEYIYEFEILGKRVIVHKGENSIRVMHISEMFFECFWRFLIDQGANLPKKIKWKLKR